MLFGKVSRKILDHPKTNSVVRHNWTFKQDLVQWAEDETKKKLFGSKHMRWVWWKQG